MLNVVHVNRQIASAIAGFGTRKFPIVAMIHDFDKPFDAR